MLHRDLLGQNRRFSEEFLCAVYAQPMAIAWRGRIFVSFLDLFPRSQGRFWSQVCFGHAGKCLLCSLCRCPGTQFLNQREKMPHQQVRGWSSLDQDRSLGERRAVTSGGKQSLIDPFLSNWEGINANLSPCIQVRMKGVVEKGPDMHSGKADF